MPRVPLETLPAVQPRQRHLGRSDQEEVVTVDLVHLMAIGGKEPGIDHHLLAHQHRRYHRDEPVPVEKLENPLDERELQADGGPHQIGEAAPRVPNRAF
jgi:hypothetical protein